MYIFITHTPAWLTPRIQTIRTFQGRFDGFPMRLDSNIYWWGARNMVAKFLPGTLNNNLLMDVWWNNHFLCNDLEASNWNNH